MTDFELRQDGYQMKFSRLKFGVGFPVQWGFAKSDGMGGDPVEDAGTLHFTVASEEDELYEDGVTVSTTLKAILQEMIDGSSDRDGVVDGDIAKDLQRLADEFRARAEWLESKISVSAKTGSPA